MCYYYRLTLTVLISLRVKALLITGHEIWSRWNVQARNLTDVPLLTLVGLNDCNRSQPYSLHSPLLTRSDRVDISTETLGAHFHRQKRQQLWCVGIAKIGNGRGEAVGLNERTAVRIDNGDRRCRRRLEADRLIWQVLDDWLTLVGKTPKWQLFVLGWRKFGIRIVVTVVRVETLRQSRFSGASVLRCRSTRYNKVLR